MYKQRKTTHTCERKEGFVDLRLPIAGAASVTPHDRVRLLQPPQVFAPKIDSTALECVAPRAGHQRFIFFLPPTNHPVGCDNMASGHLPSVVCARRLTCLNV